MGGTVQVLPFSSGANSSIPPPSTTPPPRQQLPIGKCDGTSKQPTSPSPGKRCRYLSGQLSLKRSCHPSRILLLRSDSFIHSSFASSPSRIPTSIAASSKSFSTAASLSLRVAMRPIKSCHSLICGLFGNG
ncbi:hypothetical protein PCANC_06169 [Puccinia coronata f. sp. avenae]|uniref:Uncharacterized protein n=1 Tax=Puccinia coronata f. sp. avenae TaxID=200324 RepID=A0A2N5VTI9_9BASI|nr:hypothetical protein PCANC_06169 [Puccinia coronata f. sp. avenae]